MYFQSINGSSKDNTSNYIELRYRYFQVQLKNMVISEVLLEPPPQAQCLRKGTQNAGFEHSHKSTPI